MTGIRKRMAGWLRPKPLPAPVPLAVEPRTMRISTGAEFLAGSKPPGNARVDPFARYQPAPGVLPVPRNLAGRALAFDYALPSTNGLNVWALGSGFSEGVQFLGFAYLAELSQRAEYRRIAELWAEHATRKWIKLRGPDEDRLGKIEAEFKRLQVREVFREAFYTDAVFGRAQIFLDMDRPREVDKVLPANPRLVGPSKPLKAIRIVEPMWSYPGLYASTDPLAADFYQPQSWFVYSQTVHTDRFVTIIGKPVPDLLKPAYAFGGLSRLQMAKPYVDNWLKTRESTSDLLSAFSQMVLATDMSATLQGDTGASLYARVDMFNKTRDNRGTMVIDKSTEELTNVTTSLAGLSDLQAAAQEQMASVAAIPLSIYLQITPQGLNASSENEIRSFYADVHGYQEAAGRPGVQRVLELVQLSLDGKIDPDVTFEFESLWETSDVERATMLKTDADRDAVLVDAGAVSNEEIRDRMNEDESGPYYGRLAGPAPEPEDDGDDDDDPSGGGKVAKDENPFGALDAWSEGDHPRDAFGRFGAHGHTDHAMRAEVLKNGDDKNQEHLTGYDATTGERFATASGSEHNVKETPEMKAALNDASRQVVLHHNHPGPASLSRTDLLQVATRPGLKGLWAHSTSGSSFYAEKGKKPLTARHYDTVDKKLRGMVTKAISSGYMSPATANHLHHHIVAETLHDQGRLKYDALLGDETKAVIEKHKGLLSIIKGAL